MKIIPLSQYRITQVDDEDYERLFKYNWFYNTGYAMRNCKKHRGSMISMASEILQTIKMIDHKDSNKLNNQKDNLRICTYAQNQYNQKKTRIGTSSKYKGVGLWKRDNKWQAYIGFQDAAGKKTKVHLGFFFDEEEAAIMYDEAAREYFGEFAALNFPREGEQSCLQK